MTFPKHRTLSDGYLRELQAIPQPLRDESLHGDRSLFAGVDPAAGKDEVDQSPVDEDYLKKLMDFHQKIDENLMQKLKEACNG